jgi:hypothetical protein
MWWSNDQETGARRTQLHLVRQEEAAGLQGDSKNRSCLTYPGAQE